MMDYLRKSVLYAGVAVAILSGGCSSGGLIIDGYKVSRRADETTFVCSSSTNPQYGDMWPTFLTDVGNDGTIDFKFHPIGTPQRGFSNDSQVTEAERRAVKDISDKL